MLKVVTFSYDVITLLISYITFFEFLNCVGLTYASLYAPFEFSRHSFVVDVAAHDKVFSFENSCRRHESI